MIRVAINGYGRIGRVAHRIMLEKHSSEIEVVGINAGSSTDLKGWMYLLKYDSAYGPLLNHELSIKNQEDSSASPQNDDKKNSLLGFLVIDGKEIPVFSQKDPTLLPWGDLNVDIVVESTGHFLTQDKAKMHLTAGAKSVLLSAPSKEDTIPTYVLSVNSQNYQGETVISNASCTTNCIAPVARIIQDHFGIEKAMMTTIHSYTSDQRLQDGGHKDYRRGRAAAQNIVPTTTGATQAAAKAIPSLKDKFNGLSIRVPTITGSLADFTFVLSKETTKDEVNKILTDEANQNPSYRDIVEVSVDPLVSTDIIGNPHSAIVDLSLTQVVGGNLVKVIAWYDNEYGYANRLVEEILLMRRQS